MAASVQNEAKHSMAALYYEIYDYGIDAARAVGVLNDNTACAAVRVVTYVSSIYDKIYTNVHASDASVAKATKIACHVTGLCPTIFRQLGGNQVAPTSHPNHSAYLLYIMPFYNHMLLPVNCHCLPMAVFWREQTHIRKLHFFCCALLAFQHWLLTVYCLPLTAYSLWSIG
jgi:hypothetical protein